MQALGGLRAKLVVEMWMPPSATQRIQQRW
jgi:hypothetical protein